MGKVLDFIRGKDTKVLEIERARLEEFSMRMARIKCSLEKINDLMRALKEHQIRDERGERDESTDK